MIGGQMFRKPVIEKLREAEAGAWDKEGEEQLRRPEVPDGMFRKCDGCGKTLYEKDVEENRYCCPKCGKYFRISPQTRIKMITDAGSFSEWDTDLEEKDPLQFPGYKEKLQEQREKTGLGDAVVTGEANIRGLHTAIGVMSPDFMMGSMGTVVGERITRMVERATLQRFPVILFCCSGGARMQEGILSLMQMAKVSQALKRHDEAGLLYISVLTDPTMGGVTASFAMLGDVILAEPGAMIGFAGARVIRQTIGQKLPEGFQSAEFLQKHGFTDHIVKRENMRRTLWFLLDAAGEKDGAGFSGPGTDGSEQSQKLREKGAGCLPGCRTAWERVCAARSMTRPAAMDYVQHIFDRFLELRGDRCYGDDRAVIGGIARLSGSSVLVIGQQKGRSPAENRHRNFGMPSPEGYRKALRLMKLAEKLRLPVILFVDTPGAFCGIEAEERGQGQAIARNLFEMAGLTVPVLSIVIGEGGSGGALALAVANQVWMLENSVYSVLSPEGFAAILWKDGKRVQEAAEVMKITAADLLNLGVIDRIISENDSAVMNENGGYEEASDDAAPPEKSAAHREDMEGLAVKLKQQMLEFLAEYEQKTTEQIVNERYERFRRMGQ